MDDAAPIARRLEAMRAFHAAGVRTTCFISPIFPGITDVPAIIRRARGPLQPHLAGEPQPARRLQKDHPRLYRRARSLPHAPLRGHLRPRRPRLLGGAGRGESAPSPPPKGLPLRARRRLHPPPLRGPAARGQLLFPRGDHPLRQARKGAKRRKDKEPRARLCKAGRAAHFGKEIVTAPCGRRARARARLWRCCRTRPVRAR